MKHAPQFFEQWQQLRDQQLFYEDVRDLSRVHELKQMQFLGVMLRRRSGSLLNFTSLSKEIRVSVETVRRWMTLLDSLYHSFQMAPWSKNVTRSLLKESKVYLWDWSLLEDAGQRAENFIALYLLKSCQYWSNRGYGKFSLHFLRDKEKREVDFIVCKNEEPWFLAEVKSSSTHLSKSLAYFQEQTKAKHIFQVVINAEFEDINCFDYSNPIIISARTFLSQLV